MNYRHSKSADANQLLVVIVNRDAPDVRRSTDMERPSDTGHRSTARRADVIGIDFHPDAEKAIKIDTQIRGSASYCFRQRHRRTTVQATERLHGRSVHRHGRLDIVMARLGENDLQMLNHTVPAAAVKLLKIYRLKPYRWLVVHVGSRLVRVHWAITLSNDGIFEF